MGETYLVLSYFLGKCLDAFRETLTKTEKLKKLSQFVKYYLMEWSVTGKVYLALVCSSQKRNNN